MKYLSLIILLGLSNATGRSLLKELRAKSVDPIRSKDKDKYSLEVYINGEQYTMADAIPAGDDAPEYLTGWEGTAPKNPMEASVKHYCRGVIKMLGGPNNENDGVKFTSRDHIKTVTINMIAGPAAGSDFSVVLFASGTEHHLGLDGTGKTFFIQGGNWPNQPEVRKDKSNRLLENGLSYVSVYLKVEGDKVIAAKLNGVEAWGDLTGKAMSGRIKGVAIRPQRNNRVYIPAVRNDCSEFPAR